MDRVEVGKFIKKVRFEIVLGHAPSSDGGVVVHLHTANSTACGLECAPCLCALAVHLCVPLRFAQVALLSTGRLADGVAMQMFNSKLVRSQPAMQLQNLRAQVTGCASHIVCHVHLPMHIHSCLTHAHVMRTCCVPMQPKELQELFADDWGSRDPVCDPGSKLPSSTAKTRLTSLALEAIQDTISDLFSRVGGLHAHRFLQSSVFPVCS